MLNAGGSHSGGDVGGGGWRWIVAAFKLCLNKKKINVNARNVNELTKCQLLLFIVIFFSNNSNNKMLAFIIETETCSLAYVRNQQRKHISIVIYEQIRQRNKKNNHSVFVRLFAIF